ncbi:uncharacterized protein LOC119383451 isoform X2 [Rhipicephalus sanguineus]|uniref:uncharacterized protein LOC119383451 isoform X2 n=1 Tax=Rhipicephalus sanguineus TaxID=34632 RepID=UPI0020C44504|nr:uncharacterized protein LOC119383451 isoform X2 [Rhipicephalus sanguineus]
MCPEFPVLHALKSRWTRVNLTEEADHYIKRLINKGANISSWGLGADYEYWINRTHPWNVYPITARGHDLWCGNDELYDSNGKIVRLRMIFNVTKSVQSPFPAIFNATLPLIKLRWFKPETAQIDMNNATRIVLQKNNKDIRIHKGMKFYRTTCKFQGRINYAGYFAYKDSNGYHKVGVGHLHNSRKGLVKLAEWYLEYFVEGTYEQRIIVSVE